MEMKKIMSSMLAATMVAGMAVTPIVGERIFGGAVVVAEAADGGICSEEDKTEEGKTEESKTEEGTTEEGTTEEGTTEEGTTEESKTEEGTTEEGTTEEGTTEEGTTEEGTTEESKTEEGTTEEGTTEEGTTEEGTTEKGKTEAPKFSSDESEFLNLAEIKLSCDTEGAKIYYTLDGSEPNVEKILINTYLSDDDNIVIRKNCTIKAIAVLEGKENSEIVSKDIKIKVGGAREKFYKELEPNLKSIFTNGSVEKDKELLNENLKDIKIDGYQLSMIGDDLGMAGAPYDMGLYYVPEILIENTNNPNDKYYNCIRVDIRHNIEINDPVISPNGGKFNGKTKVEIKATGDKDGDIVIVYTKNGEKPMDPSGVHAFEGAGNIDTFIYDEPFFVDEDTTITAVAYITKSFKKENVEDNDNDNDNSVPGIDINMGSGGSNVGWNKSEMTVAKFEIESTDTNPETPDKPSTGSTSSHKKSKKSSTSTTTADKVGSSVSNPTPSVKEADANKAVEKALEAAVKVGDKEAKAEVVFENVKEVAPDVFKAIADKAAKQNGVDLSIKVHMDSVENGKTTARMYINPQLAMALKNPVNTLISTSSNNADNAKTTATFTKYFKNETAVVSFDQKGDFGMKISAAVKVDLAKLNTKALKFYSYDTAKNTYKLLADTNQFVDVNGYLHFDTVVGNTVVITDSPLESK